MRVLPDDVSTRWNSTFELIQEVLIQKKALKKYAQKKDGFPELTDQDLALCKELVHILSPFEEETKRVRKRVFKPLIKTMCLAFK